MRNRSFVTLLSLGLAALATPPVLAADRVDLADLDPLGDVVLGSLTRADHDLALAEIHLAGAEQREDLVKEAVKSAKRDRGAQEADLKAAKAELEAARKNADEGRARLAEVRKADAERILAAAQAFQDWKEQEQKAAQEGIKAAKAELELRKAELEYARADLVVKAKTEASSKYGMDDFAKAVENLRKKSAEARDKLARATDEARKLQAKWTELPKSSQE